MEEGEFDAFSPVMEGLVEAVLFHFPVQQVEEAIFGPDLFSVEDESQARIQIGVVPKPLEDEFLLESEFFEERCIGGKFDVGPVLFLGLPFLLLFQNALDEPRFEKFPFALAPHEEMGGEGVDRFGSHAVQTDGKLEHIVIVLCAGVDLADAFDHFAQRNAPPEVPDRNGRSLLVQVDQDFFPFSHDELVDRIVDHLFDHHIDPVVRMGAISKTPNVHPWTQPDVRQGVEGLDCAFVVFLGHIYLHSTFHFFPFGLKCWFDSSSEDMKEIPLFLSLASDNFSGIHPEVMQAIEEANRGHAMAYGADPWTKKAEDLFKHHFGPHAEAFITYNGTAANVCALKHILSPWQSVLCPENAHIWTDECGAVSGIAGCTVVPLPAKEGKLSIDSLKPYMHHKGNPHHAQPGALSITQTTEYGTLYTLEELQEISRFAKKHDLLFHMDGARLSNAAAALGLPFKKFTTEIGVDLVSFGGTKNGLMGAEAIVFLKPGLSQNFPFVRKQNLQLASKMRFLSAQFVALLENDLWLRNARHANAMAKSLEEQIRRRFPQLRILYPVEANALFVQLPSHAIKKLQEKSFFWIWDEEESIARWMTTWDTQPEFLEQFLADLKSLLSK